MNSRPKVHTNWLKTFSLTTNQFPWLYPDFSLSTKFPYFSLFSLYSLSLSTLSEGVNKWEVNYWSSDQASKCFVQMLFNILVVKEKKSVKSKPLVFSNSQSFNNQIFSFSLKLRHHTVAMYIPTRLVLIA